MGQNGFCACICGSMESWTPAGGLDFRNATAKPTRVKLKRGLGGSSCGNRKFNSPGVSVPHSLDPRAYKSLLLLYVAAAGKCFTVRRTCVIFYTTYYNSNDNRGPCRVKIAIDECNQFNSRFLTILSCINQTNNDCDRLVVST